MTILAIETSCDETAAAVVQKEKNSVKLLANVVASSLALHAKTNGIIPEIAARQQVEYILPVIDQALKEANVSSNQRPTTTDQRPNIDAIAVTYGPGLIGSLLVGVETAKTLSYVWQKPIIPVNHLIGHIYANFIGEIVNHKSSIVNLPSFPAIGLIVSGGHTDLLLLKSHTELQWLGGTRDDAAGEAFDKIGRLLGLPYPGGPAIEKAAKNGNPKAFQFPRPLIGSGDFDFSFSGLKTAVFREVQNLNRHSGEQSDSRINGSWTSQDDKLSDKTIADISASAQAAVIDILIRKTLKAAEKYNAKSILLGGGVSANQTLSSQFMVHSLQLGIGFFVPPKHLCTDNAAMIGAAACFYDQSTSWQNLTANPELYFD